MRDVEAVVTPESKEQVVAGDTRDRLRLEAEQLADAVVLVDDVVAGAQVGEALERSSDPDVGTRRALAEDLRVREQDEPELAPHEAASRGRDREQQLRLVRQLTAVLHEPGLHTAEEVLGPERLSTVRKRDDDPLAGALVEQIYENALLLEGLHPNPAEMVGRIQQLMEVAARKSA